jgi:hypothetical protein
MAIVTYVHRSKRQRSKSQTVALISPAIVAATGKRERKPAAEPKDDPEGG